MKLLIASDVHGVYPRAAFLAESMARHEVEGLVLLGDLLSHGPRNPLPEGYDPVKTAECLNTLKDRIIAVKGNCDAEVDQMMLSFALSPQFAWIFADGVRIQAAHGHLHDMTAVPETAGLVPGDVFLSGHTHVPMVRMDRGVHIWNPGSIALPKQGFPPSYAVFDEGRFSVLALGGDLLMEGAARS